MAARVRQDHVVEPAILHERRARREHRLEITRLQRRDDLRILREDAGVRECVRLIDFHEVIDALGGIRELATVLIVEQAPQRVDGETRQDEREHKKARHQSRTHLK